MRALRAALASGLQLLLWTLRDFLREPTALFWSVGFPILMTLALGQISGRGGGPLRARVAVLAAAGEEARADAWIAQAPDPERIEWVRASPAELPRLLATGKARLGLERAWDPALRRWRFDPANQSALLAYHELRDRLEGRASDLQPLDVKGGRYIDFLLPGLLALGLVNACLWGVGWGLVEMREKRLLRLMLATPLRPATFFAALFLGRVLLGLGEAATLLLASRLLFGVEVQGSWTALLTLWVCGLAAFFGLGVLVGSRTAKASVGQGLVNAVTLPVFVVSGVFFGLDNFPAAWQAALRAFPPTLLVDATRAVMNAGAGWEAVAGPCAALLAMGAACYLLGRRIFRFH